MEEHPNFTTLCHGYFHQDWMLDHSSYKEVIQYFIKINKFQTTEELHLEIINLLESQEIDESFLYNNECNFKPSIHGMTVKEWLQDISEILVKQINNHYCS